MSGGNKAVELQMQMRQNADDLHTFMRELESWEEDIKKKDEQLRTGNLADTLVCSFNFTFLTFYTENETFNLTNKKHTF